MLSRLSKRNFFDSLQFIEITEAKSANTLLPIPCKLSLSHQNSSGMHSSEFPKCASLSACEVGVGQGQTNRSSIPQATAATSPCFQLGRQHFADQICIFTTRVHSAFYSELSQGVFYRKCHCNMPETCLSIRCKKMEPSQAGADCRQSSSMQHSAPNTVSPPLGLLEPKCSDARGKVKQERSAGMGSWRKESGNKVRNLNGSAQRAVT